MAKKLILCDLETAENNYKYDCSKLGDDWGGYSDYDDPCLDCSHHCYKEIEFLTMNNWFREFDRSLFPKT